VAVWFSPWVFYLTAITYLNEMSLVPLHPLPSLSRHTGAAAAHLCGCMFEQDQSAHCEQGSKMNQSVQSWLRHGRMSSTQSSISIHRTACLHKCTSKVWGCSTTSCLRSQIWSPKIPSLLNCTQTSAWGAPLARGEERCILILREKEK